MGTADGIRFGVHSGQQNTSLAQYLEIWQTAEQLGLDWASVFDHFMPIQPDPTGPCFDGPTLLSAMAAHTTTIRCGLLVAAATYRHPAVLANIGATIDHISAGRLELGLGAGWYEAEHQQYGIPFGSARRRIRMLGEAAQVVRSLWTKPETSFSGDFYTLSGARCEPKCVQRPHPPLWIGGAGERYTLRVVAESADGWNTFLMPEPAYRHKLDALAAHCADLGRDPETIRKSLVVQILIGETADELEERLARLGGLRNLPLDVIRRRAVVGTPEQCAEQLMAYVRLGVRDFLIATRAPVNVRTLELVATQLAPAVKIAAT